jgi:cytochrome c
MRKHAPVFVCLLLIGVGSGVAPAHAQTYGIGHVVSEKDIAPWNIDVSADGSGLPAGKGSVAEGKKVYETNCIACHGVGGQGKPADQLVGGQGTLKAEQPVKTIGSFWPYATILFDFVTRAMPYDRPKILTPNEVYAVTAYLLNLNGIVGADTVLDAKTLPQVRMPNRDGFVPDPRPDVSGIACRSNCK